MRAKEPCDGTACNDLLLVSHFHMMDYSSVKNQVCPASEEKLQTPERECGTLALTSNRPKKHTVPDGQNHARHKVIQGSPKVLLRDPKSIL